MEIKFLQDDYDIKLNIKHYFYYNIYVIYDQNNYN